MEIFKESFKNKIRVDFQSFQITKQDTPATFAPIEEYDDFFKEHGYYIVSEWEPNGWQVDFWNDYYNPTTKDFISLRGSLYYGDFVLYKSEDYSQYNEEYLKTLKNYDN